MRRPTMQIATGQPSRETKRGSLQQTQGDSGRLSRAPTARRQTARSRPWLSLAVIRRVGGGRRTKANLKGRLRTTANGFEDRGAGVRSSPPTSAQVHSSGATIRYRPLPSAFIRRLGCHLGCRSAPAPNSRAGLATAAVTRSLSDLGWSRCRPTAIRPAER